MYRRRKERLAALLRRIEQIRRVYLPVRSLSAADEPPLVVDVERHSAEKNEALDQQLVVAVHPEDRHAVVEHTDDQTTDDGAGDGYNAARDRRGTDEDGRDRIQLEAVSCAGAGEVEARREDD